MDLSSTELTATEAAIAEASNEHTVTPTGLEHLAKTPGETATLAKSRAESGAPTYHDALAAVLNQLNNGCGLAELREWIKGEAGVSLRR